MIAAITNTATITAVTTTISAVAITAVAAQLAPQPTPGAISDDLRRISRREPGWARRGPSHEEEVTT